MLKVSFFLTDPHCELSRHYAQMVPRLDQKYAIEIQTVCMSASEYLTDEYFALDLPMAPGVMVGGEIVAEGDKVGQYKIESVICRHLGIPGPKFNHRAFYERCMDALIWINRYRRRWKAYSLGKRTARRRFMEVKFVGFLKNVF